MKALISLQVLPDAFATDPDRLARFEREAKTLAALTAVSVEATGPTFRAGTPTTLVSTAYATPDSSRSYDVSPDGQQFLMIKEGSSLDRNGDSPQIVVIQNWLEEPKELRRSLPFQTLDIDVSSSWDLGFGVWDFDRGLLHFHPTSDKKHGVRHGRAYRATDSRFSRTGGLV
jgi:hypothetical protein